MNKLLLLSLLISSIAVADVGVTKQDLTETEQRITAEITNLRRDKATLEKLRRKVSNRNKLIAGLVAGVGSLIYIKLVEKNSKGITTLNQLQQDLTTAQANFMKWWNEDEQETYRSSHVPTNLEQTTAPIVEQPIAVQDGTEIDTLSKAVAQDATTTPKTLDSTKTE